MNTMRLLIAFSSLLLVLWITSSALGQVAAPSRSGPGESFTIQGKVYGPNGQPLERPFRIQITGPRFSAETVETDVSGSFSFRASVPGKYTATVDAPEEFEHSSESLIIDEEVILAIKNAGGSATQISIYLKARHGISQPAKAVDAKLEAVTTKARVFYESGLKFFNAGQLAEAAAEFKKAIEVFPNFYQAYVELGKAYLKLANFDDAILSLQTALKLEPNNFATRLHLGMAYLNQKKFPLAEEQLIAAAKIDTFAVTPQYYLGVIKYESNDIDGALTAFEKANELNGTKPHPMLHKYLAGVYLKKNDHTRTAAELEIYLAQSPDAKDAEQIRKTIEQLKKSK